MYKEIKPPNIAVLNYPFEFDRKEGLKYFDWFMNNKEKRIKELIALIDESSSIKISTIKDNSFDIVSKLDKFLKSHLEFRELNESEKLEWETHTKSSNMTFEEPERTPTSYSLSILYDSGILFGEQLKKQAEINLKCGIAQESKRSIDFNQIVLDDKRKQKPFNFKRILQVYGEKVMKNYNADLVKLFETWLKLKSK